MKNWAWGQSITAVLLGVGIVTFILSCRSTGLVNDTVKNERPTEYLYGFALAGCETGVHEFSSQSQLCAALMDERRNRGCAKELRQKFYRQQGCGTISQVQDALPVEAYLEI